MICSSCGEGSNVLYGVAPDMTGGRCPRCAHQRDVDLVDVELVPDEELVAKMMPRRASTSTRSSTPASTSTRSSTPASTSTRSTRTSSSKRARKTRRRTR